MRAEREIQKRIKQKEEEVSELRQKLVQAQAYLDAMKDSLRLIQKTSGGNGSDSLRPGSLVDKARKAIQEAGKPLHVDKILKLIGKEATKQNKISLSGSLASYVRQRIIFTRPAPNTFSLIEIDETHDELPEGFGQDT
jgi:hypothetical protein